MWISRKNSVCAQETSLFWAVCRSSLLGHILPAPARGAKLGSWKLCILSEGILAMLAQTADEAFQPSPVTTRVCYIAPTE